MKNANTVISLLLEWMTKQKEFEKKQKEYLRYKNISDQKIYRIFGALLLLCGLILNLFYLGFKPSKKSGIINVTKDWLDINLAVILISILISGVFISLIQGLLKSPSILKLGEPTCPPRWPLEGYAIIRTNWDKTIKLLNPHEQSTIKQYVLYDQKSFIKKHKKQVENMKEQLVIDSDFSLNSRWSQILQEVSSMSTNWSKKIHGCRKVTILLNKKKNQELKLLLEKQVLKIVGIEVGLKKSSI